MYSLYYIVGWMGVIAYDVRFIELCGRHEQKKKEHIITKPYYSFCTAIVSETKNSQLYGLALLVYC